MDQASPRDLPAELAEVCEGVGRGLLLVVTGAGVSLASGIPTFRGSDPGAVWKRDITELGTVRYFRSDPVGSWQWYLSRFEKVLAAKPNPAHLALAKLEAWQLARGGRFLLVTQNIDTLHEQGGSREMIKVHGSADRVRCSHHGCPLGAPAGSLARADIDIAPFQAEATHSNLPRCPQCGSLLRQHVLWFDEFYNEHHDYQWERVQRSAWEMSACIFVGTSFAVGVTELFLQHGATIGIPMLSIDPQADNHPSPWPSLRSLPAPAEQLLPALVDRLGMPIDPA